MHYPISKLKSNILLVHTRQKFNQNVLHNYVLQFLPSRPCIIVSLSDGLSTQKSFFGRLEYAENGFKESRKKPGFSSFPPNLFGIKPMVFQLRSISIPSLSSPQVIMHSGFWNFRGEIVKNWRGVFNTQGFLTVIFACVFTLIIITNHWYSKAVQRFLK